MNATPICLIGETRTITISRDQDWNQSFFLVEGTRGRDLTDCTVEMHVRPTFDHATLIKLLSSDTGEIVIDDATHGEISIVLPRADVVSDIPVSVNEGWSHFLRVIDAANAEVEWFRGPLIVRAGKLT